MSMQAARFVHWIHWIFLVFVLFGWLLPWQPVWIVHLLVVPGLILHWRTNNNRCVLTEMEERLKQANGSASSAQAAIKSDEDVVEGQFIKGVIERLTGQVPSETFMTSLIYGVMVVVWLLSLVRVLSAARVF